MDCAKIKRAVRRPTNEDRLASGAIRQHLLSCRGCREALRYDLLTGQLIRSLAAPRHESELTPSPFFLTRLRAQLDAEREERGLSPWEGAIMAARGWLLAFGAIVAVMCGISLWSLQAQRWSPAGDPNAEVIALPPGSENILIANGDSLSHDAVLFTLLAEENNNGRK